jgi:hypothetical protein
MAVTATTSLFPHVSEETEIRNGRQNRHNLLLVAQCCDFEVLFLLLGIWMCPRCSEQTGATVTLVTSV